jgi:endoglycosylceramidase
MVSWMWWAYCGCDDPTTTGPGNLQAIVKDPREPPRGSNVLRRKLALMERPYPQVVAGTPTSFGYDADANTFQLTYRAKAPGGPRLDRRMRTRVYVPRSHYRDGYDTDVKGARVLSDRDARYLILQRRAGASRVSLTLTPG